MNPNSSGLTAYARFEQIDTIPYTANSAQTLRTNGGLLPNDRFMTSMLLELRCRLTMPGSTGPSAVRADGVAGLIERITVEGYHKGRQQQEKFFDLRGSDVLNLQKNYVPSALVNTPTSISVTASATNDIILQLHIPFVPLRIPANVAAGYMLDCPNYESLKLTVTWGDFKSIVVPGSTDATLTAYGSASGSPELRVAGNFAINAQRFAGFVPGRIFRYFQEITGSVPTTSANDVRLWDIPKGFDIRSVYLKTGTRATDATSGNNVYTTYADFLTDIRLNVGINRYIRRYADGNQVYYDIANSYNLASRVAGVNIIDFAQVGDIREALNTRPLVSGANGNVDLYLQGNVTGASNQAIVACLEEVRYRPLMSRG